MESETFFMEGVWLGSGKVDGKVDYEEEITVKKLKPGVYYYFQRTWNKELGGLHSEAGYIRVFPNDSKDSGKVEFVLSHPFGVAEIEEGTYDKDSIEITSKDFIRTSTAKAPHTRGLKRSFAVKDGKLTYTVDMGSDNHEVRPHLAAELVKTETK